MNGPLDRRAYAREWAARRRAQKLAERNAGASVCRRRMGRFGRCGGVLETFTNGRGDTATRCERCERKRRGICRDCGLRVAGTVGKAIRCAFHREQERRRAEHAYADRNRDLVNARARAALKADADLRARKNARKRIWRKAHPEKVKQYKRTEALTQNPNRAAYHRKRRERDRLDLRGRERARARGITELRTCLNQGCDIVVTGRKKKCTRCKEREYREAASRLAQLQASA